MLKYSCPHCGAVYFGPGTRQNPRDRCGFCEEPFRAIYLTDEEYGAEMIAAGTRFEIKYLAEIQSLRAQIAALDAREYRGGLAAWGVA